MITELIQQQDAVYALAQSADALYAARSSGLYRSLDRGETWQDAFGSLGRQEPLTVTAVATHGSTVFAGAKGAILRSEDAGESWHFAGLSSPPPLVVALVVSPNYGDDGIVIAGTAEDGVFVSTDKGMNWVPWNFGLIDLNVSALAISPTFPKDRMVLVGTESGLFRSHNGGRAWRELPFPMEVAPVISLALSTDDCIYAGTEKSGLYLSDDDGVNWQQVRNNFESVAVNAIQLGVTNTSQVWILLEDRILSSSDQGHSWQQRHTLPLNSVAMTMLLKGSPSDSVVVGFADGMISHFS